MTVTEGLNRGDARLPSSNFEERNLFKWAEVSAKYGQKARSWIDT